MWRRLGYLNEGSWVPHRTNWLVLTVQLLLTGQAASRGMDYVQSRPAVPFSPALSVVEAAAPLTLWGCGLLLGAGIVFAGLFGGWVLPIVIGHAVLAAMYGAFAYGLLDQTPIDSGPLALLGVSLMLPGVYLGVSRWRSYRWVRFLLAFTLLIAGGWVTAAGLGYDFRTGTGLLVAALCNTAFAIGVSYMAYRRPPAAVR